MHRDDIQLILNQIFKTRPDLKSVKKIEEELEMGAGTLAKAMKQVRDLPEKWILPLQILANPTNKIGGEKKTGELETRMEVSAEALNKIIAADQKMFDGGPMSFYVLDEMGQCDTGMRFKAPELWIKQIRDYCKKHGITPQDFADSHCVDLKEVHLSEKTIKPDTSWMLDLEG